MSETTQLKAAVDVEVRGSELLARLTRDLDTLIAKGRKAAEASAAKVSGFGADLAAGQERANAAVRQGLGLQRQADRQRADAARAERADASALDSDTVRAFRFRQRMQQREAREAVASERARELAAKAAERQAERASRVVEAAAVRRQRVQAAADRRREAEARSADRERQRTEARADRDRELAARRIITLDNWRFRLRERMQRREDAEHDREHRGTVRQGREAWRRGRDGFSGTVRPAGAAAVIGMGMTSAGVRRVLGAEGDVDAAEIGTRQYGGLDAKGARHLRDRWAAPTAEALGVMPDKLLNAWTDATKLGIPAKDAQGFAELATKTSEAWGVPFETVTDTLGTVNSLLTAKGDPFSLQRMQSVANALQHLAAKQSTTPEKLISFLQRGAGGADVLGMSMEGGLAFGSASTSLGNQAGQSGRMLDYLAGRIVEMPRLARRKGEDGDQARDLMRRLGYGSAEAMDRQRRADPDSFLPDFMDRFNRIGDPKRQDQAIRFFAGREWLGEFGRMVKGGETYKEAQKLAREAKGFDAIGQVWELHKLKLTFVGKQFKAGWLNILGEFGKELSPLARQAGDFFLDWTGRLRAGGLRDRFRAMLDGLMEGLGVKSFPDLLRNVFGDPKDATGGSIEAWRAAARGFGEGVRDVVGTILGVAKAFTGGKQDPETLGRLTAQVLGFGLALVVVAPFVSVLGAIGSVLMGLAFAAGAAWRVMKALGVVGGAVKGPVPGGAPGAVPEAGAAKGGGLLGRLGRLALPAWIAQSMGLPKADQDAMMKRLGKFAQEREAAGKDGAEAKAPAETPAPSSPWRDLDALRESLNSIDPKLAERLFPGGAVMQPQSFTGDDWHALIHPAVAGDVMPAPAIGSLRAANSRTASCLGPGAVSASPGREIAGSDRTAEAMDRLRRTLNATGNRITLASFGPALGQAAAGAVSGSAADSYGGGSGIAASDPAQRYGKRFFTVPGGVPGFGGGGRGDVVGGGVTDPRMSGDVADRAKAAHDFFRSKGLSEEATAGILASMKKESNFTPNARGDGGAAHGLFQHHADRRAAIMRATGINMSTASFGQQLEGAWWEMNHGDAGALRALRALRTPGITARQAGAAFVQNFERPARDERAERGALAEGMLRQFGGTAGPSGDVDSRIGELQRTGAIANQQCVALVKAFSGSAASVLSWRKGEAAEDGTLKPGTPVATFLNRDGSQSGRYAGGGIGTPGAGLDHAAVFKSYVRDAAGKIVGMNVAEQYAGSGGVHDRVYRFGQGRGERNGSNYHAVLGEDRQPLGLRNPMRTATAATAAASDAARKALSVTDGAQEVLDGMRTTGWQRATRNAFGGVDPMKVPPADTVRDALGASPETVARAKDGRKPVIAAPEAEAPPSDAARAMIRNVPTPPPRPPGLGGDGGRAGSGIVVNQTIHGYDKSPKEIADMSQRHITEAWNHRAHDLEAELT